MNNEVTDTEFVSLSEEDTEDIAARIAGDAKPGDVYALEGDLGAGKTVFARGFARGLGVPDNTRVVSPTYTLMQIYEGGRLPLYHFDMYRLADSSEALDAGFDEYLYGSGVSLVEWASRIEDILPQGGSMIRVLIDRGNDDNVRRIRIRRCREI